MYLLSFFVCMVLCIGFMACSSGGNLNAVIYLIDAPSLVLMLLIVMPMLLNAGLLKDLNNAFRLGTKRKVQANRPELIRAVEAVSFTIKALWTAGIFGTVLSFVIIILREWADASTELMLAHTAISMITLCYAVIFVILLLPLRSRLKVQLELFGEESINIDTACTGSVSADTDMEHDTERTE